MPRLTGSKEEIKGMPPMVEGLVTIRLDGFKPRFSKDKQSINLNPQLKVINHPEYNDRILFENLNSKAKWIWKDFCHAFGVPVEENGDAITFPGKFGDDDDPKITNDPESWPSYEGPLLGQTGQVYIIQSDYQGTISNKIKFYVCKMGTLCNEKHSSNLVK